MDRKNGFRPGDWLEDIVYAVGIGCLAGAGFLLHPALGLAAIGAGLVALALLMRR